MEVETQNNWTIVATFNYGFQAHLVKSKLESEEIDVILRDELNAQVCDAGPNAIGGIKLCVREKDASRAMQILKEGGFINEHNEIESKFKKRLSRCTSKVPFFGKLAPELVLIVLIVVVCTLIFIPIAILYIP